MANTMKQLLTDIKTRLGTEMASDLGIRAAGEAAIWVVPDNDFIPLEAQLDQNIITLKDSTEEWTDFANIQRETDKFVDINVFTQIYELEDSIMGRGTQKGVLDLVEAVKDALTDYLLPNITNQDYGRPVGATGSDTFITGDQSDDTEFLQRKTITMKYTWEETV